MSTDDIVRQVNPGADPSIILSQLLKLETEKFSLLKGKEDFPSSDYIARLRNLELEVQQLRESTLYKTRSSSADLNQRKSLSENPNMDSNAPATRGTKTASLTAPLYTLPNALQYDMKIRDSKQPVSLASTMTLNSEQLNESITTTDSGKFVQGSKERKNDIKSITDRVSEMGERYSEHRMSFAGSMSLMPPGMDFHSRALLQAVHTPAAGTDAASSPGATVTPHSTATTTINTPIIQNTDHVLEFCIVEADWNFLTGDDPYLSPLVPPIETYRYPSFINNTTNNTQLLQNQQFFFPSGVDVQYVTPSVVELLTKPSHYKRHIVPFTDKQGTPNYACCLTVVQAYATEDIKSLDPQIIANLVRLNKMKCASLCIQKAFRKFVAYRKEKSWGGSVAMQSQPPQASLASNAAKTNRKGSAVKDSSGAASQLPPQQPKPGFFSKLFRRHSVDDSLDSSSQHNNTPVVAVPVHEPRGSSMSKSSGTASELSPTKPAPSLASGSRSKSLTVVEPAMRRSSGRGSHSKASPPVPLVSPGVTGELHSAQSTSDSSSSDKNPFNDVHSPTVSAKYAARNPFSDEAGTVVTVKEIIIKEITQHAMSPQDLQEIFQLIFDVTVHTNVAKESQSTAVFKQNNGFSSPHDSVSYNSKEKIANLINLDVLSSEDLHDVMACLVVEIENSTKRGEYINLDGLQLNTGKNSGNNYREQLLQGAAAALAGETSNNSDFANAIEESLNLALLENYRHNRIVIAQKAYCIVTPTPEYTFIFKVLGAIADAENLLPNMDRCTVGESQLAPPKVDLKQKVVNRQFFLEKADAFFKENYKLGTGFVQDLSLNFTIQKEHTHRNKILDKYSAKPSTAATVGAATATASVPLSTLSGSEKRNNNKRPSHSRGDSDSDGFSTPSVKVLTPVKQHVTLDKLTVSIPGYISNFSVDKNSLLTTKEWSCGILFTHLNAQVIFKIINLLLMEKSLIIYGKNPGIVTSVTLGVINLISPFIWEGIFVPLVPDNARELFGAPVPLILGTVSPPRIMDVSNDTAILYLNDDTVIVTPLKKQPAAAPTQRKKILSKIQQQRQQEQQQQLQHHHQLLQQAAAVHAKRGTSGVLPPTGAASASASAAVAAQALKNKDCEVEFLAWFVRLPEVSADMPVDEEICRRIEYTRKLLSCYYIHQLEYIDTVHTKTVKRKMSTNSPQAAQRTRSTSSHSESSFAAAAGAAVGEASNSATTNKHLRNVLDDMLMMDMPAYILKQVQILIVAIKRNNYNFCGNLIKDPSSWKRFLRRSNTTGAEEFYPDYFMEPLRDYLEFQEAMVHTQLFVAFMDKLRKEHMMLDHVRTFISHWIYFRIVLSRKKKLESLK